ncbi:Uncharacterised protein [Klebsiella pneumoniae]|nr:Uncharacterised protein [Klebsiella pneumoniae]
MRTIIDAIKIDAAIGQRPVHPFRQRLELRFGKFTPGDTGLVSYHHQRIAHLFQLAHGIYYALDKFELINLMDVTVIHINSAVTIEKNCGYRFCHRFAPEKGLFS